ncbi:MAG: ribonuclease H-like domain-containing protein [Armatimonadota bacterium]|nr:MAG: ribonuclease H-like domain-containing protein [Armatimonadota bacterium]
MVSEELKRRISSLRRVQVRRSNAADKPTRSAARECSDLQEHFAGGSVFSTDHGEAFLCEAALADIHSNARGLIDGYRAAFETAGRLAEEGALPVHLEPLAGADVGAAALIDTETAGLHGRPLFMIGLAYCRDGDVILSQYFARNYAEEAAVLDQFAGMLPRFDMLISFNGKAFDWPFVRDRMIYHRLSCRASFAHLDLLHPSRRRWRSELPNCKLQTLERYLCGRLRTGDIPGEQIAQRYHDFVREQDARLVAPIFHHNRMDLITMMELLTALVGDEEGTPSASARAAASVPSRGRATGGGRGAEERSI